MKRFFLISLIIFNFSVFNLFSQKISNIHFNIDDEKNEISVFYEITKIQYFQTYYVELFYSNDGGKTFKGPLVHVKGDIADSVSGNGAKIIIWDVFKEVSALTGSLLFDVRVRINDISRPNKWFISYNGSLYSPYGFSFGNLNKTSFYFSGKINKNFYEKTNLNTYSSLISGNNESTDYYIFEDNVFYRRLSLTAGANFQLHWNWHLNFGLGYGLYQGMWNYKKYDISDQLIDDKFVLIDNYNFKGLETELGLRYNIKNRILVSFGVNTMFANDNNKLDLILSDVNFGLGWIFGKR